VPARLEVIHMIEINFNEVLKGCIVIKFSLQARAGVIPSTQRHYRRFFYYEYLLLLKLLNVSVVRPSSGRRSKHVAV
jgi:hypothetical protein